MLVKNLFSVVLIASSVFAAPPAADANVPVAEHHGIFQKIKSAFVGLKNLIHKNDIKSNIESLNKNPHIHGCAKFNKNDCTKWINSIKDNEMEFSFVKHIMDTFHKHGVSDEKGAGVVLKKVQEIQKKYGEPAVDVAAAGSLLERRDEDVGPLVAFLAIYGGIMTVTLLGLAALCITVLGHFIGYVPAAIIVAIAAAVFDKL